MSNIFERYKKGTLTLPGEKLGVIEEFSAGDGTYVENGNIYSSIIGKLHLNEGKRELSICSEGHRLPLPKINDVILGEITSVQDRNLSLKIVQIRDVSIPEPLTGIMHISDAGRGYVRKMTDVYQLGDVIRAKVISLKNREIHLSTQNSDLGVIKGFCVKCGSSLPSDQKNLTCVKCGMLNKRKLAIDYGQ